MNVVLWIIAALLALAFVGAGAMKITTSREELLPKMPWVADFSASQVRGIGALEVLGAVGPAWRGLAWPAEPRNSERR